ncbi:sulfurtransferase TusA family protein [Psychrobacter urativorans]|uniref:UPF0033 domain-containing protein n=1 Tax=Psychrobacter urativorans TaxID=45610 RepID=A0A0M4TD19_9GAMM|nr:sulfurtransferase TusA family protein [Psychrobacter urativorans]ALF59920.1 hypothetical protein AOC03_07585 [Psychrobacter urativorans]
MSTDHQSTTTLSAPYHIRLAQTLSEAAQTTIASLLTLLPADCIDDVQIDAKIVAEKSTQSISTIVIKNMVDGRGLACPMPLLKTKVALRNVDVGESLYVVATDPNSQADIRAFCQQTQQMLAPNTLLLVLNQTTSGLPNDSASACTSDTIFHFIITKTDSN